MTAFRTTTTRFPTHVQTAAAAVVVFVLVGVLGFVSDFTTSSDS